MFHVAFLLYLLGICLFLSEMLNRQSIFHCKGNPCYWTNIPQRPGSSNSSNSFKPTFISYFLFPEELFKQLYYMEEYIWISSVFLICLCYSFKEDAQNSMANVCAFPSSQCSDIVLLYCILGIVGLCSMSDLKAKDVSKWMGCLSNTSL